MASVSRHGVLSLEIAGRAVAPPVNWQEVSILAEFSESGADANVTTTELELVGDAYRAVESHIAGGLSGGVGIFEGLPCTLRVSSTAGSADAFDGFIDCSDGLRWERWRGRVFAKIKNKSDLNGLSDQLASNTFGYLSSIGVFTQSDYTTVEYVAEKEDNALELAISAIALFLMIKETAEAIKDTTEAVADVSALLTQVPAGTVGAAIKSVGHALVMAAYSGVMVVTVAGMANDLFAALISPVREAKALSFRAIFEKVCTHLGYPFESSIPELDNYFFLPSIASTDIFGENGFVSIGGKQKAGIPASGDYGYLCSEMFSGIAKMFWGRLAVKSGTVHLHNADSSFWERGSAYAMPAVRELPTGYNTNELYANRVVAFATDLTDEWTVKNFAGTNCETITRPISVADKKAVYIKGLDSVNIPWALGNRKEELNPLELALKTLGEGIDAVTGIFGGGTDFAGAVESRIGMLRVSQNRTSMPKVLYLQGGKIPANHREKLSAKYLEQAYHSKKSFASNAERAQKLVFESIRIPFGFSDYLKTLDNSMFTDASGRVGGFSKLEYSPAKDTANASYWVREVYTRNLREDFIEG